MAVRPRTAALLALALTTAAACGGDNGRIAPGENVTNLRCGTGQAIEAEREILRRDSAEISGWDDSSWTELGGRPEQWPADYEPPSGTTSVGIHEECDTGGKRAIMVGTVPVSEFTLETLIVWTFGDGWERTRDSGGAGEVGVWERDGISVRASTRGEGISDESTYELVVRRR